MKLTLAAWLPAVGVHHDTVGGLRDTLQGELPHVFPRLSVDRVEIIVRTPLRPDEVILWERHNLLCF